MFGQLDPFVGLGGSHEGRGCGEWTLGEVHVGGCLDCARRRGQLRGDAEEVVENGRIRTERSSKKTYT